MPGSTRVFYDGSCRLCVRQARLLTRLDRGRGRVELSDITAPGFDAASIGIPPQVLRTSMLALEPDGSTVSGMGALRAAARALGLGWLLACTGWPILRPMWDALYTILARNRFRLFGRCDSDMCAQGRTR